MLTNAGFTERLLVFLSTVLLFSYRSVLSVAGNIVMLFKVKESQATFLSGLYLC